MLGWEVVLKLVLAMVAGGIIGLEREIDNRPAGFRTHTLVCVGAALVMLTSQYVFNMYHHVVNLDPARLGAQVISGIGFLGAGTIIKHGFNVRGLTTAASLWVVACVGLAIGAGFYWGAVTATVLVYVTLILLKKIEGFFVRDVGNIEINLEIRNIPGQIAKVTEVMGKLRVHILDIKMASSSEPWINVKFLVRLPTFVNKRVLLAELARVEGVITDLEEG